MKWVGEPLAENTMKELRLPSLDEKTLAEAIEMAIELNNECAFNSQGRYIPAWSFSLADEQGHIVWSADVLEEEG